MTASTLVPNLNRGSRTSYWEANPANLSDYWYWASILANNYVFTSKTRVSNIFSSSMTWLNLIMRECVMGHRRMFDESLGNLRWVNRERWTSTWTLNLVRRWGSQSASCSSPPPAGLCKLLCNPMQTNLHNNDIHNPVNPQYTSIDNIYHDSLLYQNKPLYIIIANCVCLPLSLCIQRTSEGTDTQCCLMIEQNNNYEYRQAPGIHAHTMYIGNLLVNCYIPGLQLLTYVGMHGYVGQCMVLGIILVCAFAIPTYFWSPWNPITCTCTYTVHVQVRTHLHVIHCIYVFNIVTCTCMFRLYMYCTMYM